MEMKMEIRGGGVHIEGYVNAVLRESRPVITPRGKVNEVVEQRTFQNAIDKASNIDILLDHKQDRKLGSTTQGNLKLHEDEIGLRAETDITDPYVVEKAKSNQIRGWSFGFTNATDSLEMRAEKLPLRHLKNIDLKEVSLIIDAVPCYSATSVEVRAGNEEVIERRDTIEIEETKDEAKEETRSETENEKVETKVEETKIENEEVFQERAETPNYEEYQMRILKLRKRG